MITEKYENTGITKERYEQATQKQKYVFRRCWDMWDPRTVIPMEVGDWYNSELEEDKDIHTVLDCSSAMDYLVDPFTSPPFGLNHRVHSPTNKQLRFDLRAKNHNNSIGEVKTLRESLNTYNIAPKYATRMKLTEDGVEWFRIIYLKPLIAAIEKGGYRPETYSGDDYTAWFIEYDHLRKMDAFIAEFDGSGDQVFAKKGHKDLSGVE